MDRRRFLGLCSCWSAGLAGCMGRSIEGSPSPTTAGVVTTSDGAGLEFLVSQVAIPAEAEGPNAYYRIRNPTDTAAVIRLETRLTLEAGATYTAVAVVTVPAGEEITVSYQIVPFAALDEVEAQQVRNGEVQLTVIVNGEERNDS